MIEHLNNKAANYNWRLRHFTDLPEKLREYAEDLEVLSDIASELSSERLPKTTDYGLYFLHAYVLKATGKPQWRGLAILLEAAYAASGVSVDVDDDLIRKKVTNLRDRDERRCSNLERRAEDYIQKGNGEWLSRQDLLQIAKEVAQKILQENEPEPNLPK